MNFCPGCGCALQPDVNFCPKCGRQLKSEALPASKRFSFSKIKESVVNFGNQAKESRIGSTLSSSVSGVVSKVKGNIEDYRQWDRELVRKRPLVLPDNTPDTPVYVGSGGGSIGSKSTTARYGKIVLTRKSILFYDVPTAKMLLPGKQNADKLEFKVNLPDIESLKKETNKLGMTSYSMMVKGAVCNLNFRKDSSKMIFYISKLAGLDGNLLNINLRDAEKIIDTCNVNVKILGLATMMTAGWQPATLYLTNQRMVINKSTNDSVEGGLMIFEREIKDIDEISEERNAMNCVYTVQGYGEPITLKFAGVVPKWFMNLVKDGQGNADLLKRKSKVMKGSKIALLAASFLGLAGEVDAETDIDMDDDLVDIDNDGIDDTLMVDSDGDGFYDTAYIDTDGDGIFDTSAVDMDGDGVIDAIGVDVDGDGTVDAMEFDTDGDGAMDSMIVDSDGDGNFDTMAMDTTGDGAVDTIAMDTDGDGAMDAIAVDNNGDGNFDTMAVDRDGDGRLDTFAMDTGGNGAMDTLAMDSNGDGRLDMVGKDVNGDGALDVTAFDTNHDGYVDTVV